MSAIPCAKDRPMNVSRAQADAWPRARDWPCVFFHTNSRADLRHYLIGVFGLSRAFERVADRASRVLVTAWNFRFDARDEHTLTSADRVPRACFHSPRITQREQLALESFVTLKNRSHLFIHTHSAGLAAHQQDFLTLVLFVGHVENSQHAAAPNHAIRLWAQ